MCEDLNFSTRIWRI